MTPLVERVKGLLEKATNDADWGRTRVDAAEELRSLIPAMAKELVELAGEVEMACLSAAVTARSQELVAEATATIIAGYVNRATAAEKALVEVDDCFNAAFAEGWIDALANGDIDRIRDLWSRRIYFASIVPAATLTRSTKPEGQNEP